MKLSLCLKSCFNGNMGTERVEQSNCFLFKENSFLLDEIQTQPQISVSLQRRRKEMQNTSPPSPSLSVLQLMSRTIPARPGIPSLPLRKEVAVIADSVVAASCQARREHRSAVPQDETWLSVEAAGCWSRLQGSGLCSRAESSCGPLTPSWGHLIPSAPGHAGGVSWLVLTPQGSGTRASASPGWGAVCWQQ